MKTPNALTHHGYAMRREPLLSLEEFQAIKSDIETAEGCDHFGRVQLMLKRKNVELALKLGAPGLYRRIKEKKSSAMTRQDEIAIFKYVTRMSTRATPFANFAAVGLVNFQELPLTHADQPIECRIRLDSGVLNAINEQLKQNLLLNDQVLLQQNKTFQLHKDALRYFERKFVSGGFQFALSQVELSEHLSLLLQFTQHPRSLAAIAEQLRGLYDDLDEPASKEFVREVVANGILEVALNVEMFGQDPLGAYLRSLSSFDSEQISEQKKWLTEIHLKLNQKESYSAEEATEIIRTVGEIARLPGSANTTDTLTHLDSFLPERQVSLPSSLLPQLERAVRLVASLSPSQRFQPIVDFEATFKERFGDEFVPILIALDPERGIPFGYSAPIIPWIHGLRLAPKKNPSRQPLADTLLVRLLTSESLEVDLADVPLAPAIFDRTKSFSANVSLFTEPTSEDAPLAFLHYVSSPGSTSLLTRFAARNGAMERAVDRSLKIDKEIEENKIIAEIAHCPHPRSGNVLARPDHFDHVIVLSGSCGSGTPIPLSDLYLGMQQGRLTLRSRNLEAEIIPRSTSAYNFHGTGNLGIYQFLCAFGRQEAIPSFRWPEALAQAKFLPRVRCGQIVLGAARWLVPKGEAAMLASAIKSEEFETIRKYMIERKIPRYVTVDRGDQKLEIDLDVGISLHMLGAMIDKEQDLTLSESICRIAPGISNSATGEKHSEWVIPFTLPSLNHPAPSSKNQNLRGGTRPLVIDQGRNCVWRYVKIYGGEQTLKDMIIDSVEPLLNDLLQSGDIEKWHFVRYRDPEFHFRLRVFGPADRVDHALNRVLSAAVEPLVIERRLARFQSDIYVPEISRYGGPYLLQLAETLFHIDSIFAIEVFALERTRGSDEQVWQGVLGATLQNIDLLVDPSEHTNFIKAERDHFEAEIELTSWHRSAIGKRYKLVRQTVEQAVSTSSAFCPELSHALNKRREAILAAQVLHQTTDMSGRFPVSFVAGVNHMMANRIFTSSSRYQEFIIFEFIDRAMRSVKARA